MRSLDLETINAGQIEMLSGARPSKMDVLEIFQAAIDSILKSTRETT